MSCAARHAGGRGGRCVSATGGDCARLTLGRIVPSAEPSASSASAANSTKTIISSKVAATRGARPLLTARPTSTSSAAPTCMNSTSRSFCLNAPLQKVSTAFRSPHPIRSTKRLPNAASIQTWYRSESQLNPPNPAIRTGSSTARTRTTGSRAQNRTSRRHHSGQCALDDRRKACHGNLRVAGNRRGYSLRRIGGLSGSEISWSRS